MSEKPEDEFFHTHTKEEIWQRYCGFLDLSIGEFTDIQKHLLMEQIELVADSPLGKKIMKGQKPTSVEEFRQLVPLTTYEDYEPHLSKRMDDVLAEKPLFWAHSAGRGGYFKWFPYTRRALETVIRHTIASWILASAPAKGVIPLPGQRMLLNLAPRPYISGYLSYYLTQYIAFRAIPPIEQADRMEFQERIEKGFRMALRTGVDDIFSIASVLVKMGQRMAEQAQKMKPSLFMLHPAVFFRLGRAWLRCKIANRPILPRDLWPAKALMTAGTDTSIYRDDIAYYWGQIPYEFYGSTEAACIALQCWNKKGMTFVPDVTFWEFIPEEESRKNDEDKEYQPPTVLLNEVQVGKSYELVLSQFYGMPLLRYRIGDVITIVALRDDEAGINLPQMVFKTRVGETINLAGLTELDEKTIWRAISSTGTKYEDWSACKEYDQNQTYLRLYLELKESREAPEMERLIDEQLKTIDEDYRDLDALLGLQPVRVTLLPQGTFQRYYDQKRSEGADLAHLKPPHMNAPDGVIQRLLQLSQQGKGQV